MKSSSILTPVSSLVSAGPLVLLSRADLRALGIRVSNPTLLAWEADGKFPKRVTISPAKVAWLQSEVEGWIADKASARPGAE